MVGQAGHCTKAPLQAAKMRVNSKMHLLIGLCALGGQGWFAKGHFLFPPAKPCAPTWRGHLLLIYTKVPYELVSHRLMVALYTQILQ